MYKIILDDEKVVQDSIDNVVISPVLNEKINSVPTLKYSIPYDDKYFDKYIRRKSIIKVTYENNVTFKGRLLDDRLKFNGSKELTFEGELAFLNDIQYPPFEFTGDYVDLFKNVIDYYNSKCDKDKQFIVGQVTMTDANNYITRSNESFSSCWNCINDKILKYGGYIKIRYIEDKRYIDLLAESGPMAKQSIEFGKNLLDLEEYIDSSEVATVIIPLGSQKSNMEQLEDDVKRTYTAERLDIRSVNDDTSYLESNLIKKYGRVETVVTWDDVTIPKNLLTKAEKKLNELILENQTITTKVIDLHFANGEEPYFKVGDVIPIISKPHEIDTTAILVERTRNLNDPVQDTITLGTEKKTLTSSVNDSSNATNDIVEKVTGNFLNEVIKNQTKLLANGKDGNVIYVYNEQGKLSEICFMDTDDINTATNVLKINKNGLGFSNDGYYGNYRNAWTIDGVFNTDFIKAFSINVNQLKSDVGQLLDISSNKAIKMLVERLEQNTYKFEAGSGNLFDDCQKEFSKDSTVNTKIIDDASPLGIDTSFLRGRDICISTTIRVVNGKIDNLTGKIGVEFDVTYIGGTKKTYSLYWYLGQFDLEYLLQTSTVDKNERIWITYKIDDREIIGVSNLRNIIDLNADYASISNSKVEFGTQPTGFEFDLGYVRDSITVIEKKYAEIKEELDSVTITAGNNYQSITKINNDLSNIDGSITTINQTITKIDNNYTEIKATVNDLSLKSTSMSETIEETAKRVDGVEENYTSISKRVDTAEIKLQPTNIMMAVNSQINDGDEITGVSFSIDKYGLHAKGGGFDITNNAGTKVFYADGNGNLNIVGTIGAGSTINTDQDLVVGNNVYVGQNQSGSIEYKYIRFTNNCYLENMRVGSSAGQLTLHANGCSRIESYYQGYLNYCEANMLSVNMAVLHNGSQVNWFEVSNGFTQSQYQIGVSSDMRLKHDINDVDVSWIDELDVKSFFYNSSEKEQIGLIAQDYADKWYNKYFLSQDSRGYYSITYGNITNALIKYCQQMKRQLNDANLEISILKAQLGGIENAINN